MKINKKFLKEVNACKLGYGWFNRNFPDGLVVSKNNLKLLLVKLDSRKRKFDSCPDITIEWDSYRNLRWLLDKIIEFKAANESLEVVSLAQVERKLSKGLKWDIVSHKEFIKIWWNIYKEINKGINA